MKVRWCFRLSPIFLLLLLTAVACGGSDDPATAASDAGAVADAGDGETPDKLAGWISVIELNDTCNQFYLRSNWLGGVRAYFAEKMTFQRSLPHHSEFMVKVVEGENCTLYHHPNYDLFSGHSNIHCDTPEGFEQTEGTSAEALVWCPLDQECEEAQGDDIEATCRDLPAHADLGAITLTGLTSGFTLEPDDLDRYFPGTIPEQTANLFEPGATITAKVSGGAEDPFELSTTGVKDLVLKNNSYLDIAGDATLQWEPADDDSRVELVIPIGNHDPNPLVQLIVCDVPDSSGKVQLPQAILSKLEDGVYSQKCSRATRYRKATTEHLGGEIELFVGSARNVLVDISSGY